MTFVFGFVFSRKWLTSFVFVSVSDENKMTFTAPVSFSAENVYTGFGRSLVQKSCSLKLHQSDELGELLYDDSTINIVVHCYTITTSEAGDLQ